jgi:hypothetical protein
VLGCRRRLGRPSVSAPTAVVRANAGSTPG